MAEIISRFRRRIRRGHAASTDAEDTWHMPGISYNSAQFDVRDIKLRRLNVDDLLKGNFKTKHDVTGNEETLSAETNQTIGEKLRKAAMASIGGSMVYMERTELTWNGDDK
jgi:hypothetical protein